MQGPGTATQANRYNSAMRRLQTIFILKNFPYNFTKRKHYYLSTSHCRLPIMLSWWFRWQNIRLLLDREIGVFIGKLSFLTEKNVSEFNCTLLSLQKSIKTKSLKKDITSNKVLTLGRHGFTSKILGGITPEPHKSGFTCNLEMPKKRKIISNYSRYVNKKSDQNTWWLGKTETKKLKSGTRYKTFTADDT